MLFCHSKVVRSLAWIQNEIKKSEAFKTSRQLINSLEIKCNYHFSFVYDCCLVACLSPVVPWNKTRKVTKNWRQTSFKDLRELSIWVCGKIYSSRSTNRETSLKLKKNLRKSYKKQLEAFGWFNDSHLDESQMIHSSCKTHKEAGLDISIGRFILRFNTTYTNNKTKASNGLLMMMIAKKPKRNDEKECSIW